MRNIRYITILALAAALGPALARAADNKPSAEERQRPLIEVLKSGAPSAEKAITCKQLALCGNQDAVPALAPLLADPQLSSWARIALEVIPGPAADEALRAALGTLHGRLLVGAINSISVRRDAGAVDLLIGRLKDADGDADVASAAAVALGHIGGDTALKALEGSLSTAPAGVRSAVTEGITLFAERALAEAKSDEAVRLYDAIRKADVPALRVLEATRGAILARKAAGLPLLVELLQSPEKARFALGLRVARELAAPEVIDTLTAELKRAAPERQSLLILALADCGDAKVLPIILQAAQSGPGAVRATAIGLLKRLGNASCVPVLLDAAMQADEELSQAARTVLADLPGGEIDQDLAARLAKADGPARLILIDLAGRRPIAAATPTLLKAADDSDAQIRAAAITALGATIAVDDLPVLIARVASPRTPEDGAAAEKALSAACQRMPDSEACADKLIAAMSQSPVPVKCQFLAILGAVGGAKAIQTVAAAARDTDPEIREAGSRLLGSWMNLDAAPALLDLARTAADDKYKVRALRGYIRLVRQFTMPDAERAKMCRIAMETAQRDAEKKLVLELLGRCPSMDTFSLALETAKTPSLKNEATGVAFLIADKIGGRSPAVQKALAELGQGTVKLEIIKAEYGTDEKFKDVTTILQRHAHNFPVIILPSPDYNSSFGGDPAGGVVKRLKIYYRMEGKAGEISLPENSTILLPMPK
jgi:HEAT repeat protein